VVHLFVKILYLARMPENFEPRVVQMWFKNDGNNRIVNRNTRNRMSNQLADFQTFLLFVTHLMEVITKGLFPDAARHVVPKVISAHDK